MKRIFIALLMTLMVASAQAAKQPPSHPVFVPITMECEASGFWRRMLCEVRVFIIGRRK